MRLFLLATLVVILTLISPIALSQELGYEENEQVLVVTSEGMVKARPDTASLYIGIVGQGDTPESAIGDHSELSAAVNEAIQSIAGDRATIIESWPAMQIAYVPVPTEVEIPETMEFAPEVGPSPPAKVPFATPVSPRHREPEMQGEFRFVSLLTVKFSNITQEDLGLIFQVAASSAEAGGALMSPQRVFSRMDSILSWLTREEYPPRFPYREDGLVSFELSNLEDLRQQALAQAIINNRPLAEAMAEAAGVTLIGMRHISLSFFGYYGYPGYYGYSGYYGYAQWGMTEGVTWWSMPLSQEVEITQTVTITYEYAPK